MNEEQKREIREEWDSAWRQFDRALADLGEEMGQVWDSWALAVFLDVPMDGLARVIRSAHAMGCADGFDLVGRIRDGVRGALARLRELGEEDCEEPLRLEHGLTGLLLAWEWLQMEREGERAHTFFERLRELRLRMPEVALCERTTHMFCARVPPPSIDGVGGA